VENHKTRLIIIACALGLAAVLLTAIAVFGVQGDLASKIEVSLITMLGVLFPAFFDALGVNARRLDPTQKAVADDVGVGPVTPSLDPVLKLTDPFSADGAVTVRDDD
jgi:hypothetical protein